jgi:Ca2+/H+ antiporter
MIETIRDIFIILFAGVGFLCGLVVLFASLTFFRKVTSLIGSASNVVESVENVANKVSDNSSMGSGLGGILGFLNGFRGKGKKQ